VLQACSRRGVSYIAAGAFNGGILARGAHRDARFNYRPASAAVIAELRRLHGIAASHGVSLKAAALQFVLRHPGVCSLVAGAASAAEVEENIRLAAAPIGDEFWEAVGHRA
jgi:D-threo-aldose 1-dehydrogenase